jgi:type IV secretory pathway protease TraF
MSPARRIIIVVAIAAALVGGLVLAPRRYEVDGVSMGPGLLPGDVVATGWLPDLDRRGAPRRFDRWIVRLPDGSTGLKRIAGLPGEEVAFVTGDLEINGTRVLKGPRQLAELGSTVELGRRDSAEAGTTAHWSRPAALVLDDAPFATAEVSRLLLPVQDVGVAAFVHVPAGRPSRVRAEAGPLAVTWKLAAPGRYGVAAGRLDGHAVAVAWPLPTGADEHETTRTCLPVGAPDRWDVVRPWPGTDALATDGRDDDRCPSLAIAVGAAADSAVIDRVSVWRDILYRPAADGVARWRLGSDAFFLLGDFPSGSRDSRHFGSLWRAALRWRINPAGLPPIGTTATPRLRVREPDVGPAPSGSDPPS